MKPKLNVLASAIAALTLGVASQTATASALAEADLVITGLTFSNGATQLAPTNFDFLSFRNSGSVQETLDPNATQATSQNGTGNIDLYRCTGTNCPADNTFPRLTAPPTGQFSLSDMLLTGSGLAPGGANAHTLAITDLNPQGNGSAQTQAGLNTDFSFSLVAPTAITVSFTGNPYLYTFLSSDSILGSSVFASVSWNLTLTDLGLDSACNAGGCTSNTQIATFSPDALNASRGLNSPGTNQYNPGASLFTFTSPLLDPTHRYNLSIGQTSQDFATSIVAPRVPEPAPLALWGLALAVMGVFYRRRKS